jgi:hypothetical protein
VTTAGRCSVIHRRKNIRTGRGHGKHAKVVLQRGILRHNGRGRDAIFQRVHFVTLLVGGSGSKSRNQMCRWSFHPVCVSVSYQTARRTHARTAWWIRRNNWSESRTGRDCELRSGPIETRDSSRQSTQALLSLHDQITGCRPHSRDKVGPPLTTGKGAAFLDARQDPVRGLGDLGMARLKVNGAMDNGTTRFADGRHGLD